MGWVAYHLILVRVNSSPALFITDRCVVLDRDQAQHPTSVPSLSMTFCLHVDTTYALHAVIYQPGARDNKAAVRGMHISSCHSAYISVKYNIYMIPIVSLCVSQEHG